MITERKIFASGSSFRDIRMPVRVVKDRPIGTFSHDVESLRENSFAIVRTRQGEEIGLISKARNYSSTEYDIMLSYLNNEKSSVNELSDANREDFFSTAAIVTEEMHEISGLHLAVGFNQHPNGHNLPYRNELGQKNRVQTLQPLHVHIYETEISSDGEKRMGDLDKEDQRDICDPLILLSGEILMNELLKMEQVKDFASKINLTITNPPLGLNLQFPVNLNVFLREHSSVLSEVQTTFVDS